MSRWRLSKPATPAADLLLLLGLGLLLLAAGLGLRDPWPADEPRFALIARDMVLSGQWLIPRVGGELYSDKPPLFMWLAAGFYWLSGELRLAFLLPSLLAGLGMLTLVYDLGRRLWGRQIGLYAGLLLLFTVLFSMQVRSAQLDALVTFWITLGLYGLLRHLLLGPAWGWYYLAWFAMGLGVITKGVGFLPVFLFLPWLALRHYRPQPPVAPAAPRWCWCLGPLAMLAAISLWLLPMLLQVLLSDSSALAAYRDDILLRQTAGRYANSWHHIKPFWYYLTDVLPWAWLPLTLALPWLLPAWGRRLRQGEPTTWLLLGWIACVLLFFSISPGKRGVYMLPTTPALALAAAPLLPELLQRTGLQRLLQGFVWLFAALAAAVAAFAFWIRPGQAAAFAIKHGVEPHGLLLAAVALGLTAALLSRRGRGAAALALLLFGLWQLHGWWAYPLLNPSRSGSELMALVEEQLAPDQELGLVDWEEQFLLYLERPTYLFGFRRDVAAQQRDAIAWLRQAPNRRLMLAQRHLAPCLLADHAQPLLFRHRRLWVLVGPEAIAPDCPASATAPEHVRLYAPLAPRPPLGTLARHGD